MTRNLIQALIITAALAVGSSVRAGPFELPSPPIPTIELPPAPVPTIELPPPPVPAIELPPPPIREPETPPRAANDPSPDVVPDTMINANRPVATSTVEAPKPTEPSPRHGPLNRRTRPIVAHPELSGLLPDLRSSW